MIRTVVENPLERFRPTRSLKLPKGGLKVFSLRPVLTRIHLTRNQIQALTTAQSQTSNPPSLTRKGRGMGSSSSPHQSSAPIMRLEEHYYLEQPPPQLPSVLINSPAKLTIDNLLAEEEISVIPHWIEEAVSPEKTCTQEADVFPEKTPETKEAASADLQGGARQPRRRPLRVSNSNSHHQSPPSAGKKI